MMFKKIYLIFFNLLLIFTCVACNPQEETTYNFNLTPPQESWQVFQGENLAIALPENFIGGNPTRELKNLTAKLKQLDCISDQTTEKLEQNVSKSFVFLGFLPECDGDHLAIDLNIINQKIKEDVTLDQYLQDEVNKLKNKYQILEQEIIKINNKNIGRIITQVKLEKLSLKQVFYIVPNEDTFFILTYSTPAEQFEQKFSIFEESIKTFQTLPQASQN